MILFGVGCVRTGLSSWRPISAAQPEPADRPQPLAVGDIQPAPLSVVTGRRCPRIPRGAAVSKVG